MWKVLVVSVVSMVALSGCAEQTELGPQPPSCDSCDGSYDSYEPNDSNMTAFETGPIGIAAPVVATLRQDGDSDWFEAIALPTDDPVSYKADLSTVIFHPGVRVCLFFDEERDSDLLPAERLSCAVGERTVDQDNGLIGCCTSDWGINADDRYELTAVGTYIGDQAILSHYTRIDAPDGIDQNAVYLLMLDFLR
ncbi:MAG: hypothetical protein KJO07_16980 [Deltaproteobacteria bacterium]|nr:hypothetical protein [Deltaproteobacteria bacterium]